MIQLLQTKKNKLTYRLYGEKGRFTMLDNKTANEVLKRIVMASGKGKCKKDIQIFETGTGITVEKNRSKTKIYNPIYPDIYICFEPCCSYSYITDSYETYKAYGTNISNLYMNKTDKKSRYMLVKDRFFDNVDFINLLDKRINKAKLAESEMENRKITTYNPNKIDYDELRYSLEKMNREKIYFENKIKDAQEYIQRCINIYTQDIISYERELNKLKQEKIDFMKHVRKIP